VPTLTVVVEQLLAPVPGGTGRVTAELTTALAATAPAGWRVRTVCAWHRSTAEAVVAGPAGEIRPRRLPFGRRVLTALWERGLPPLLRGDAVLAPTPLFPPAVPTVLQRFWGRQRQIVIVHDAVPYSHPETLSPRGVRWHRRMIGRAAARADAIVVPTLAVAAELAEALTITAPVTAVGWGVGRSFRVPQDGAERVRRLGLTEPYLLFVGTVEPRKGLDRLIAALGSAQASGSAPVLAIAGPIGWGNIDLDALIAAAGLSPGQVRQLGRLDDADLTAVMAEARALVAPSRSEGFGLPVLEAMALGVPVVVSAAPALVELVGDAGTVAEVGDPAAFADALAAAADPANRPAIAARVSARAAGYSWPAAARAVWELATGGGTG
jgi:glycosyltransferase involved in cell wall biosynthesis